LKGFEREVEVYELVGFPADASASKPWCDAFAEALKAFVAKDFETAEAGFHCVEKLHPKDGPAKFYLKHIAELREHGLPEKWSGGVELKEK
jgi:hypothetical protein